jgi:hypothetical protein
MEIDRDEPDGVRPAANAQLMPIQRVPGLIQKAAQIRARMRTALWMTWISTAMNLMVFDSLPMLKLKVTGL